MIEIVRIMTMVCIRKILVGPWMMIGYWPPEKQSRHMDIMKKLQMVLPVTLSLIIMNRIQQEPSIQKMQRVRIFRRIVRFLERQKMVRQVSLTGQHFIMRQQIHLLCHGRSLIHMLWVKISMWHRQMKGLIITREKESIRQEKTAISIVFLIQMIRERKLLQRVIPVTCGLTLKECRC